MLKLKRQILLPINILFSEKMQSLWKYFYLARFLPVEKIINTLLVIVFFMYKINEFIFFNEDDLLENYNTVRDKVNADIKKEFDSKTFQNKKLFENKYKVLW